MATDVGGLQLTGLFEALFLTFVILAVGIAFGVGQAIGWYIGTNWTAGL